MARYATELEYLELVYSERMNFIVQLEPTEHPQLVLARFNHPTGLITKYCDYGMLSGTLDTVCGEIESETK